MSRQYTQDDINAMTAAETALRARGLIVDEADGAESKLNADQIVKFFDLNPTIQVTQAAILDAVERMKNQMYWKSAVRIEADEVISHLTPEQKQTALEWFKRQKRLVTDGDEGYKNVAEIIGWLVARKYPITEQSLQTALTNVQNTRGTITWKPAPTQESQGRPGHKDDGQGFMNKGTDPRYRGGKLNHAYQEPGSKQETPKNLDPSEAQWKAMAEALRGNTHSKNAELEHIHGRTWRETYELRKKALNVNPVTITRMGAA